jgi:RNA polymerase sigma-70 factor (ECF subfamily)
MTDDADLVRLARQGDRKAMAALLERHRPLVLAVCRGMLGGDALAEDAAQEAAIVAVLELDRLRRPERFGSWLAGIGLNVCRRWLRYRRREAWSFDALVGGRHVPDRDPSPDVDPAAVAEEGDLRERVRRAVAELPPGQRAAVALVYLDGLSQSEAAAALGIAPGAVKTRLHKARAVLRARLIDEAPATARGGTGMAEALEPDDGWVIVRLADVARAAPNEEGLRHHVLVLDEEGGERRLLIWVGEFEAAAAAVHLAGAEMPRPLSYAFAAGVLAAAGGRLREVRVADLNGKVFVASAIVEGPDGLSAVDARPSDAINLALVAGAPIRVASAVMDAAATTIDTDSPLADPRGGPLITADRAADIAAEVLAR